MSPDIFYTTALNVLLMMLYMSVGYLLKKIKLAKEQHLPLLSVILIYVCTPVLISNAFFDIEFSPALLGRLGLFLLAAGVTLLAYFLLVFFIAGRKKQTRTTRLLAAASILGNVGFIGLPILKGIFPDDPMAPLYCSMFMIANNILVNTIGPFALTGDKKFVSVKKAFFNSATLGLVLGLIICVTNLKAYVPAIFRSGISTISAMSAPLCMFILGIRLAVRPLKEVFTDKFIYIAASLKMIGLPLLAFLLVRFLPLDLTFKGTLVIIAGMPVATLLLGMAELYDLEQERASHAVLFATVLSVILVPLLTLLMYLF